MASLREQLLKAGLVNKQKAETVRKEQQKTVHHQQKTQKKGPPPVDPAKLQLEQAAREQAERSRELNRRQQEKAARRELQAQLRQIIDGHRLDRAGADIAFSFVDRDKVKKVYVTSQQQAQLVKGTVAVIRFAGRYDLVTDEVAEKITQRDPQCVALWHRNGVTAPAADPDDPYAQYQVPDDLMW